MTKVEQLQKLLEKHITDWTLDEFYTGMDLCQDINFVRTGEMLKKQLELRNKRQVEERLHRPEYVDRLFREGMNDY